MENKATIKPPIPTTSGFRNFAFCSLIFALPNPLSSLSSRAIITIVPLFSPINCFSVFSDFSVAISFVPLCLSGHESIMQNKPNFLKDKTNATFCFAKVYEETPPLGDSKKQTQSNPIPAPPAKSRVNRCQYGSGASSANLACSGVRRERFIDHSKWN